MIIIDKIIGSLVPLAAVIISYYTGLFTQSKKLKYKALEERYKDFYIPYFKLLMLIPGGSDPKKISVKRRLKFANLMVNYIYLMGYESSNLVPSFYTAHNRLNKVSIDDPEYDKLAYTKIFFKMEQAILKEGSEISEKLAYPNLARTIYKLHLESLKESER